EHFQETYLRLADLPWTRMHVFPYSERPGTYAVRLPEKVPAHVITRRAARLRELSLHRWNESAREQVGSVKRVLWLKRGGNATTVRGVARDYWTVHVPASAVTDL